MAYRGGCQVHAEAGQNAGVNCVGRIGNPTIGINVKGFFW